MEIQASVNMSRNHYLGLYWQLDVQYVKARVGEQMIALNAILQSNFTLPHRAILWIDTVTHAEP